MVWLEVRLMFSVSVRVMVKFKILRCGCANLKIDRLHFKNSAIGRHGIAIVDKMATSTLPVWLLDTKEEITKSHVR